MNKAQKTLLVIAGFVILLGGFFIFHKQETNTTNNDTAIRQPCIVRSVAEKVERADLIIIGRVFAVIPNDRTGATVLIEPDGILKGELPERGIEIAALDSLNLPEVSRTQDEINFTSTDGTYLLFLRTRPDGQYDTSLCDGSRLLGTGLLENEKEALGTPALVI
ncbi:MAG: hypothetical protein WCV86_00735 [Patescibacteria group bacterium]|jgi:hypothetical protein